MTAQFELLFEGLADDSASTLRRLKGIFIADLDFPASDVQRFLENAPITIKSAGSENELKETYNLLQKAGAKVLIVKPDKTTLDPQSENSSLEPQALALEFDSVIGSTSKEVLAVDNSFNNSLELSLDFDTSPITSDPIKSIEITSNTPQKVEDSFDGPTFDLSFEEPESHTATTSTQLNSGSDVKSNQAEESLTQSNSNFGLELSLEENKQEAEKPAAFSSPVEEVLPQDLGLELDVVTPESSTLFGHHESSNHTEEPNDKVTATQSAIPGLTLPPVPALVAAPVSEIKVEQQPIINQSDPTTTAEEIPVELTWEQLKELQTPPSKPFKLSVIPILTILCLGILFYVNQIFFNSGSKENPFTTLIEQLPKISTEPSSEEQAKILAEKAAELAQTSWYTSEQNFSNLSVKATVWVEKTIPIHGSIEITTPEPAPLSKEEIVSGVLPKAWLRRLEIKDLSFQSTDSTMLASGPALAYISIGDKNIRLAGNAKLKATLNEDKKTLSLEAVASSQKLGSEIQFKDGAAILQFDNNTNGQATYSFNFAEKTELIRP